jgi:hypothetical protein
MAPGVDSAWEVAFARSEFFTPCCPPHTIESYFGTFRCVA